MIKLFDKSTENVRVVTSKDAGGNHTDAILMEVNYTNEDGNIACTTEVILTETDLINMLDSLSNVEDAADFQYKEQYSDEDLLELINIDMFNYLREPSVVIPDLVKIIKVLDARLKAVEAPRTRFG